MDVDFLNFIILHHSYTNTNFSRADHTNLSLLWFVIHFRFYVFEIKNTRDGILIFKNKFQKTTQKISTIFKNDKKLLTLFF